jgi:thioredoxin 1
MIEINTDSFEHEVLHSPQPVLVDFWGPKCVSCLALMPKVEGLSERYGNRVKITKVEAPKNRRLCLTLKVLSLPTFLFFKDGKEVDRLSGDITIQSIEASLEKLLS